MRPPTLIFVYEGDAYYRAADWTAFEARVRASPQIRVVTLDKARVAQVCPRCARDSHGAGSTRAFADAYFDPNVRAILDAVRAHMRERPKSLS